MPSHRKRIGYLPKREVHDLIELISKENNFSQSRVTGLLVEEALRSRGLLNNHFKETFNDINIKFVDLKKGRNASLEDNLNNNYNNLIQKNNCWEEDLEMINQFIEYKFFKKIMDKKSSFNQ